MIKVNCNEGRVEVRGRDFQHELSAVKSLSAEKEYSRNPNKSLKGIETPELRKKNSDAAAVEILINP